VEAVADRRIGRVQGLAAANVIDRQPFIPVEVRHFLEVDAVDFEVAPAPGVVPLDFDGQCSRN